MRLPCLWPRSGVGFRYFVKQKADIERLHFSPERAFYTNNGLCPLL